MRFCVNCARSYERQSSVCPDCLLDQEVAEATVRGAFASDGAIVPPSPEIGFPGEVLALYLAIIGAVLTFAAFGVLSLGIVPLLVGASLLGVYTHLLSARRNFVEISSTTLARYEHLAMVAGYRLGVRPPRFFVRNSPEANAYATGVGRGRCVVVHSALLNDFPPEEVLFVLGHELGHLRQGHTRWLILLEPARANGVRLLLAPLLRAAFHVWSVKAEHTADQAGLIACRDLDAAIAALVRISSGVSLGTGTAVHELGPTGSTIARLLEYGGTHPSIASRVEHLRAFASSRAVKQYLAGDEGGR
jgi:Zn-dependent protease with chaperone function